MIEFKSLSKTPDATLTNSHYYCDYIELLALVNIDDGIRIDDVYDRFLEDERIRGIGSESGGEENGIWISRVQHWFDELYSRTIHYGEHYPFISENNRIRLREQLDNIHYLYIFLLLCSSLNYITNYHTLTTIFEKCSYFAMKKYLPDVAEVHQFGVSTEKNERYKGKLIEKYKLLAQDLKLVLSDKPNLFRDMDNGDGGVDIVAWVPFKDDPNLDKKQIFMGQSACGKNWNNKQASVDRIKNYLIDLPSNAQNILFVPYDFRDSNRCFCQHGEITASIIFDRHRIIKLVNYSYIADDEIMGEQFEKIIHATLNFKEDII
ncbi:hypothetical protein RHO12_04380 [Orbus sturtevantii]|uniref:hypothetical protein n=1 Tax=Orbus sturtevantii TaxID=3074109 RepID=UPI00370DA17E